MMTINDQIVHLIKQHGAIGSAELFELADLVETRKQLGNSLNRLRVRGRIERGEDGRYRLLDDTPADEPEDDKDDPLADTGEAEAKPDPQPEPNPEPAPAPEFSLVRDELANMGYGPRSQPEPEPEPEPEFERYIYATAQDAIDNCAKYPETYNVLPDLISIRNAAFARLLEA